MIDHRSLIVQTAAPADERSEPHLFEDDADLLFSRVGCAVAVTVLWLTDTRDPDSPYMTAFFHDSNLPTSVNPVALPSRNLFFEFELSMSDRGAGIQASDIELVSRS